MLMNFMVQEQGSWELPLQVADGIAKITIRGVMDKLPSLFLLLFGGTATAMVTQAVKKAAKDEEVKTILLVIDSPGGSVDGLAELADALYAARGEKRVIAQVDGMTASAGYYAASQANQIFAHRMDMVGSIGTIMMLYDFSKMFEKDGIEAVPIDTGEFKHAGWDGTEITREQRADFQRIVDAYFADFLAMIERGRTVPNLKEIADGRIFVGQEALDLGLIDGIQTYEETYGRIRAGIGASRLSKADTRIRLAELLGVEAFTHNSKLAESEPAWGSVDKTKLPRAAYADKGEADAKSTWKYPHHWVENGGNLDDNGCYTTGTMWLHKAGLNAAWAAAQGARSGKKASEQVISHLNAHRKAIGADEE